RPLTPPLFPYTTLFRSPPPPVLHDPPPPSHPWLLPAHDPPSRLLLPRRQKRHARRHRLGNPGFSRRLLRGRRPEALGAGRRKIRSEEHTSELQSRENLV